MTARLIALDLLLTLLVAGLWLGAAATVLGGRTRIGLALIGAGALATAGRVATVSLLAGAGWEFVQEKVLLALPLVVIPGAATVVLFASWAIRLGWARGTPPSRGAIAVLFAAAGGGLAGVVCTFVVGYPVTPAAALVVLLLVAVAPALALSRGPVVRAGAALVAVLVVGVLGLAWFGSLIPDRLNMGQHAGANASGAHAHGAHSASFGPDQDRPSPVATSVADLRGPIPGPTDTVRRFTLTARQSTVTLASGAAVPAWTFDGQLPGPELAVTQGDLVEVRLRNADITGGVTLHWHGYRVPAGEDGVAGITQDAVLPGGEFTYRFRADEPGTYWYHSHQVSSQAVRMGLFGVLVVRLPPSRPPPSRPPPSRPPPSRPPPSRPPPSRPPPSRPPPSRPPPSRPPPSAAASGSPGVVDLAVPVHTVAGTTLFGAVDGWDRRPAPSGTAVRLRLVNTDDAPHIFTLHGSEFRLAAVDGRELTEPGLLRHERLPLAAGGRYDLTFTMPTTPVQLTADGQHDRGVLLSTDGAAEPPPAGPAGSGPVLDITRYGAPRAAPLGATPRFDREFTLVLDRTLRFLGGVPSYGYPVNGKVYPNISTQLVRTGDLVKITVVNRGIEPHPMHPHGHAVLVLARNGVPATGAPLWMDTFEVGPGEVWQVALRADNPGIWMNHCHNLDHATQGMSLHLAYEGIHTPFTVGAATGNHPE